MLFFFLFFFLFLSLTSCQKSAKDENESSQKLNISQNSDITSDDNAENTQLMLDDLNKLKEQNKQASIILKKKVKELDNFCQELYRLRTNCPLHSYIVSRDQSLADCSKEISKRVFSNEINIKFTKNSANTQQEAQAVVTQDMKMTIFTVSSGELTVNIPKNPPNQADPDFIINAQFRLKDGSANSDATLFDIETIKISATDSSLPLNLGEHICVNLSIGGNYVFTKNNKPGCADFQKSDDYYELTNIKPLLNLADQDVCTLQKSLEELKNIKQAS